MSDSTRFLTLADVADVLKASPAQVYALVRRGELRAIKIGGRGQWRVEVAEVERYIAQMYERAAQFIHDHPFTGADAESELVDDHVVD
jgi:excisionase family DNA binding protein